MSKDMDLDELIADMKEKDAQRAEIIKKINDRAVGDAASIREKLDGLSTISGISIFDLLNIRKEDAVKHFGIKEKTASTQTSKKTLTKDDAKVKEVRATIIDREVELANGKTVIIKEKGPLPKEVRKMILAGDLK
jgi:hypothetical protein